MTAPRSTGSTIGQAVRGLIIVVVLVRVVAALATCAAESRTSATSAPPPLVPHLVPRDTVPISAPPAPDDDSVRALRTALEGSDAPLDRLVVLGERDGERLFAFVVPGESAYASWSALRDRVDATGRWPVVLGDGSDVGSLLEDSSGLSARAILAAAGELDVERWLVGRHAEVDIALGRGPWPEDVVSPETPAFTIGTDLVGGTPLAEVAIVLLPTRDGAEAPAWLTFGDWNSCPPDAVHVAFLRRWEERFGAVVYGISVDTIEMEVARPPADRATALALADQQSAYGFDIVAQRAGTVEALAASLVDAPRWNFWWD